MPFIANIHPCQYSSQAEKDKAKAAKEAANPTKPKPKVGASSNRRPSICGFEDLHRLCTLFVSLKGPAGEEEEELDPTQYFANRTSSLAKVRESSNASTCSPLANSERAAKAFDHLWPWALLTVTPWSSCAWLEGQLPL